ncbi:MAG: uracil-DNA glycosylase family protein, partial [Rikenellaceae bacterium]|nr:uracil-DNA glycosylase family protein [Rikenellaceae bacterium]
MIVERHPLEPFVPEGAKLLMLGSFPPAREKWSMDFYYPNFINDMWRIFGVVFFSDKDHFLLPDAKRFDKNCIINFLTERGIALFDAATAIIRTKNNASDKFLEVVEPTDIRALLDRMPDCTSIMSTGQKSSECICTAFGIEQPNIGGYSEFFHEERMIRFYRMPSSSRAYPKPLMDKAEIYSRFFKEIGLL